MQMHIRECCAIESECLKSVQAEPKFVKYGVENSINMHVHY